MLKRIFLVFLALFVLLLLSLAIWSRTSGVTLTGPDNQQLGWSADTGEWLFLDTVRQRSTRIADRHRMSVARGSRRLS